MNPGMRSGRGVIEVGTDGVRALDSTEEGGRARGEGIEISDEELGGRPLAVLGMEMALEASARERQSFKRYLDFAWGDILIESNWSRYVVTLPSNPNSSTLWALCVTLLPS